VIYERDPGRIYAASFATIRREATLQGMPADVAELAIRIIHASGMTDVATDLAWSEDCVAAGRAALAAGAPVLCDCDMVAAGVIRRALPAANDVIVTVHAPEVSLRARADGTTRSRSPLMTSPDDGQGARNEKS